MAVDKKTVIQNIIVALLVAVGLFFSVLLMNNSWIKILLLVLVLVSGALWFATHRNLKRTLKYFVIFLLIFGISFSSFERYFFWNAGYPSTYSSAQPSITLSYPAVLNVSISDVVQSAETTVAFSIFRLEHPGDVTFESILLDTTFPGGRIEVTFYNEATNIGFGLISSAGYQYHASNIPWIGHPPSRIYSQQQSPEQTLKQIDSLGLQWFFNRSSETYENKTNADSNVTRLEISTQWQQYGNYQGIILQMIAWQNDGDSIKNIFNTAFKPDGTLLYITTPK